MANSFEVPKLGRLTQVDLREVWASEPYSFTPWLAEAENLQFLAEALDIPRLELVATERQVDVFSADIVARAPDTGQTVLIENQIERTDHTHLGQVLTYAAGLEAAIIVWVARRFTEGHRAALDWLNHITADDFAFFGVEVEAYRIGASEPAPKFNVVSRPNEWARQVRAVSQLADDSPQANAHEVFWRGYETAARTIGAPIRVGSKPVRSTNYYVRASDRAPVYYCAYRALSVRQLGAYFTLQGEAAGPLYEALERNRDTIEGAYGSPLTWKIEREGRLYSLNPGPQPGTSDETDISRQQQLLAGMMKQLHAAIQPALDAALAELE